MRTQTKCFSRSFLARDPYASDNGSYGYYPMKDHPMRWFFLSGDFVSEIRAVKEYPFSFGTMGFGGRSFLQRSERQQVVDEDELPVNHVLPVDGLEEWMRLEIFSVVLRAKPPLWVSIQQLRHGQIGRGEWIAGYLLEEILGFWR